MLDITRGALLRGGVEVRLRPKSFAVLQLLVERHGELVTKEQLLDRVWGRTVVSEGAITQCLIDVRRAIGDSTQQTIRTLPRRGYVFDSPVTTADAEPDHVAAAPGPEPAAALPSGKTHSARLAAVAALLLTVAAGLAGWIALGRDRGATSPLAVTTGAGHLRNSIAVLPFVNLTGQPQGDYFSDGISEEILHLLAQADGLQVIARTSSFAFKGQRAGIQEIAAKLGVDYVVEGSVRRSGTSLRITAQLIDAATSTHVWSNVYERDVRDLLGVQQDIAQHVANALEASLAGAAGAAPATVEPRAHDAYLRARFFFDRRLPGDLERARVAYEEALRIDPRFARAWAGLAGVYHVQIREPGTDSAALLRKRQRAVETALALDPGLAEARVRAAAHYFETGDPTRAAEQVKMASDLAPNDPAVLNCRASDLAWEGRLDESIEVQRRVVESDPLSRVARINLASTLMSAGRLEEARTEFEHFLDLAAGPDGIDDVDRFDMARLLLLEGHYDQALAAARRLQPGPDRDFVLAAASDALQRPEDARAAEARLRKGAGAVDALRLAELHARRGDLDQAFAWLDVVPQRLGPNPWFSQDWQWLYQLRFSPFLRSLHTDPRWPATTQRTAPRAYEPATVARAAPEPPV